MIPKAMHIKLLNDILMRDMSYKYKTHMLKNIFNSLHFSHNKKCYWMLYTFQYKNKKKKKQKEFL